MTTLVEKILRITQALESAQIPSALGGALALAYATEEPRGTRDIDVNVFVPATRAEEVFGALPEEVRHSDEDRSAALRDEQVRLFWDDTPVDIFFAASPFHDGVGERTRAVRLAGTVVRVLSPTICASSSCCSIARRTGPTSRR